MNIFYRHWNLFRRIAILIALSLTLVSALMAAFSDLGWIFAIFLLFACPFSFSFTYLWPFLARAIAEINHRLLNSMNPKSTWMQITLFWFAMIGIFLQFVALAVPSKEDSIERGFQFTVGLCGLLGLFVGSGNFLTREHNQAEKHVSDFTTY
ncbi:MAG: hypothetical protein QM680_07400 [Luteolibacter sp.]